MQDRSLLFFAVLEMTFGERKPTSLFIPLGSRPVVLTPEKIKKKHETTSYISVHVQLSGIGRVKVKEVKSGGNDGVTLTPPSVSKTNCA